ncbi:MAG: hypothetical protein MUE79_05820 [Nitratireductor sp.]|nr:hypothetical protein [Nitratireductor sp.]
MSDEMHLALHGLAIKKHAAPEEVAEIMGLETQAVARLLEEAKARGRVAQAGQKYMLTAPAQMSLRSEYSRHYSDLRDDAAMEAAYDEFEKVNARLKQLITDWQTIDIAGSKVANDHSNKEHDDKVITRLGDLHEHAVKVLKKLASHLPRLAIYEKKLTSALEKAEDGEIQWVSDARIASYHTVWFELHEDLLRVLDRVRDE